MVRPKIVEGGPEAQGEGKEEDGRYLRSRLIREGETGNADRADFGQLMHVESRADLGWRSLD